MSACERLAVTVWLVNPERAAATVGELLDQTTQPRVLCVAQGASPVDVVRFEDLTRGYGHRFFHWVFAPPLASLAGVWNLALRFAASGGFDPRVLVCNDDIRLRPDTMEVLTGVWERTAAPVLVSGVGRREDTWEEDAKVELDPAALLSARGGPDFSCFMTTPEAVEELGWFDEGFTPAYCEDLDFHRRTLLAGKGGGCFSVALPYLHQQGGSGTLRFMSPEQRARREQAISQGARTHYAAKWGGGVNEEKWFTPRGEGADEEALREVWGDPRTPAMFGLVREVWDGR